MDTSLRSDSISGEQSFSYVPEFGPPSKTNVSPRSIVLGPIFSCIKVIRRHRGWSRVQPQGDVMIKKLIFTPAAVAALAVISINTASAFPGGYAGGYGAGAGGFRGGYAGGYGAGAGGFRGGYAGGYGAGAGGFRSPWQQPVSSQGGFRPNWGMNGNVPQMANNAPAFMPFMGQQPQRPTPNYSAPAPAQQQQSGGSSGGIDWGQTLQTIGSIAGTVGTIAALF